VQLQQERKQQHKHANNIYIFIHQKMIATKQIRKNEKLYSGHNIENTVTYMPT